MTRIEMWLIQEAGERIALQQLERIYQAVEYLQAFPQGGTAASLPEAGSSR